MDTLFPTEQKFPEGFEYFPDFITETEERKVLEIISNIELHTFIFQGFEAKRKVASFGYDYNFENRSISKGKSIPAEFNFLVKRIAEKILLDPKEFAELLITEYPIGSVINWHRDAPPFDLIAGLSLLSDCKFRLRPQDKKKQVKGSIVSFPIKRRSLYIMEGPARAEWQHSISPVKELRYSVTLRTLRRSSL